MKEEYLGTLKQADPLYGILATRALPDVVEPIFHVSRMSRDTVYKYTEEKTGRALIGKFFVSGTDSGRRFSIDEYDNLRAMRSCGFDSPPHLVVRPISYERQIELALIEEFIEGNDLDYYFKNAALADEGTHLQMKLSELASFLYVLHTLFESPGYVDLEAQRRYFSKILGVLCREDIVPSCDAHAYLNLCDAWLDTVIMRQSKKGIVHGDSTPTNFLFTNDGNLVAIDLERMKEADAVFDLGMMCAEIKHAFLWRMGDRFASEPYITHFLTRYADNFEKPEIAFYEITQRNPFYMGLTELRIARNHYLDREYRKRLAYEALQCLKYGFASLTF